MRSAPRWLILGSVAAVSALACTSILGIQSLSNGPEAVDGSQPDTFVVQPDTSTLPCSLLHAPERVDGGDTGSINFTVATNAMQFGIDSPDTADIYYDLDNACTCEATDAESCTRPLVGGQPSPDTCDLSNGRDGTGNRAIALLTAVPGFSQMNLTTNLAAGTYGAVMSVRGYDGTADDPHVRIDIARSYGTIGKTDAGALVNVPLRNDGTDVWSYDPALASDDGTLITSKTFDDAAFVRNGVLVAHFAAVLFNLQFKIGNNNQLTLRFTDVVITGNLQQSDAGAGWTIANGRVAGRITAADLVKTFSVWNDPIIGDNFTGICSGTPIFTTVTDKLCQRLDVRSAAAEDGKGMPCNALSFGVGFSAGPMKLYGGVGYNYKSTSCFDPAKFDPNVPGTFVCK